ncbi:hypothetical protein [Nocardia pseudobrasiliensis]|uniref:Uncharacterized protein n=1 Tax=Nocardia pseudobrasiliensis TaxID=45979 RepID=A0A370I6P5_9NOCA|nr:hypothetical protein [Nocardia pseudobrasiliensis]RDI66415.1 hypothetical protein DFR76_104161 [Nocardia pseudobrasiliensis]
MRRLWIVVDLVLILLCVGAAVPSWRNGIQTTSFAASGDLPAFEATRYVGPWLGLATLLVAVAGVAVVDLVARCAGRAR